MNNQPSCSLEYSTETLDPLCKNQRMWPIFLLTSLITFISFQTSISIYLLIKNFCRQRSDLMSNETEHFSKFYRFRTWLNDISFGKTNLGKIFILINILCCISSLILYLIDIKQTKYLESCTPFRQSLSMKIDVGLNGIFFFDFLIRLSICSNKRLFLFELYSLVDMLTIPISFLSAYLNRSWIGFRFLRSLTLMNTVYILQNFNLISKPRTIRILEIISKFLSILFCVAGLIHLLENSGDFFLHYCNRQEIDFFNAIYFLLITMTTVGYGDVSCKTYLGKLTILFSLISGLALFTGMIPEFSELFGRRNPYLSRYYRMKEKKHVIICGYIKSHSLDRFFSDFLHKRREKVDQIDVLIVDPTCPDIEMESIIKRYSTKVKYFIGTVMNIDDLERIQANQASACLILANKEQFDSTSDDSANIMRVISLKNYNPNLRILLQLLRYHNKSNVLSIPGWNETTDEIVCISELKLGLIGTSCTVPGFATIMTNLFRMSSYTEDMDEDEFSEELWSWRDLYHRGAGITIYLEELSSSFIGKTYAESALICFKLGVMLLAIETNENIDIIRCDNTRIQPGSRAYIASISYEYANRIKHYSTSYTTIGHLINTGIVPHTRLNLLAHSIHDMSDEDAVYQPLLYPQIESIKINTTLPSDNLSHFDSTGMFYYTSPRTIQDALLNKKSSDYSFDQIDQFLFENHIIVCIYADQYSSILGLRNFIMPLRSSSFRRNELSKIIFLTDIEYIQNEWSLISTFPEIYIFNGSPSISSNLKILSIDKCRQCVIISKINSEKNDSYLVDKSSVLCALNIKHIQNKSKLVNTINTLTTLTNDSNVQYIEQGHTDEIDLQFFLTTPFASGRAFADSVLDCLLSCAYYNRNTVNFLRSILFGGIDDKLEEMLSEGQSFVQCQNIEMLKKRTRPRINLIPINQLITNVTSFTFSSLFCESIERHQTIVLGIYRLLNVLIEQDPNVEKKQQTTNNERRIVIYYPPDNYPMHSTDMVYVIQHFNSQN